MAQENLFQKWSAHKKEQITQKRKNKICRTLEL